MACNCLDNFNEQLLPHNVGVESQTVVTYPKGGPAIRTERVKLATYKVGPSSKPKPPVFPTYCPFCASPYVGTAPAPVDHDGIEVGA